MDIEAMLDATEVDVDAMIVIDPQTLRNCIEDWLNDQRRYRMEVWPVDGGHVVNAVRDSSSGWITKQDCFDSLDGLMLSITENAQ